MYSSDLSDFLTGIVYCSTRKQVERVGKLLGELKIRHMVYHAGLPDNKAAGCPHPASPSDNKGRKKAKIGETCRLRKPSN